MRNFDHVMDRVEREIEEIMGEKKWTPQHAQALEELLMCEKCIKEIEKMAHAKKRMMGLPAPTEEEDEEMMGQPWHFEGQRNYNYERNGNGQGRYNREGTGGNYGYNPYETRRSPKPRPPYEYHYPPYMEEEMIDPMMMMPPRYGGIPYKYGWDPMMDEKSMRRRKGRYEEDDDDDDDKKSKRNGNYEQNTTTTGQDSNAAATTTTNAAAKPR